MNITVTEFSGYSSFTCNSWVAEKCLGRKINFDFLYLNIYSLYLKFFPLFICGFLSFSLMCHYSSFGYCNLFTCCYLLRFRLFLSASLGFFGTRLFQLFLSFSLICYYSSFGYCNLFTCCYLLRFRLFLSASLGFFGTRLFQLLRELTFDLHGFRTRIPTH